MVVGLWKEIVGLENNFGKFGGRVGVGESMGFFGGDFGCILGKGLFIFRFTERL